MPTTVPEVGVTEAVEVSRTHEAEGYEIPTTPHHPGCSVFHQDGPCKVACLAICTVDVVHKSSECTLPLPTPTKTVRAIRTIKTLWNGFNDFMGWFLGNSGGGW